MVSAMKYAIIIPDGAADHPLEELDGQTPFQAAQTPNLDRIAMMGRQGTAATTPQGMPCGSDVCTMSLLGYDPRKYHKGRAPLEAAALGIDLTPDDWIFRVNFITVIDGLMQDHSAGHISDQEGRLLLTGLAEHLASQGYLSDMTLFPGVSYRNIMVDTSSRHGNTGRDWSALKSVPPHDVPGEAMKKHLPTGGPHAKLLQDMIADSAAFLADHEVNQTRRELGESPATHVWPWGQGRIPVMPAFASRFGLRGAMITAVDLLDGLAHFIGWDRLDVPGQTSYHDTDYAAAGSHGAAALDTYDVVCVHVEAPDEASHAADAATKVASIEAIDERVIAPVLDKLESFNDDWRLLVLPDHYTAVATRKHDPTPVPFVMCGKQVASVVKQPFSERAADASDLHIEHGHELMEYFLKSGLK